MIKQIMNMSKDHLSTADPVVSSSCPLSWWSSSGRYIVLGIIGFLILLLFIYVYKMLSSYSRQIKILTDIVTEQQERLNLHSKYIGSGVPVISTNPLPVVDSLTEEDLKLKSSSEQMDEIFLLSGNESQPIVVQNEKQVDDNEKTIEEELEEEIKELEESESVVVNNE